MTPQQEVNGPLDELISATEHKRDLELKLKEVKKFIEDVKLVVLEKFMQEGTKSVNKNGSTAYVKREFKVSPVENKDRLVEALISTGYEDLVSQSYNYRRLCSFVREMAENGDELPPELAAQIEAKEHYDIIVRKS